MAAVMQEGVPGVSWPTAAIDAVQSWSFKRRRELTEHSEVVVRTERGLSVNPLDNLVQVN